MLLPCTQKRRQTVVAARQPPGRVPHSAPLLGLWRLLRRSRAPAGSAARLEGPPAGATAGAGAGGGGSIEPRTAASAMARHASYSWARAAALAPWFTGACPATLHIGTSQTLVTQVTVHTTFLWLPSSVWP